MNEKQRTAKGKGLVLEKNKVDDFRSKFEYWKSLKGRKKQEAYHELLQAYYDVVP